MKKKLFAIFASALMLSGCKAANLEEINADVVASYRIVSGYAEGNIITTNDGHIWEAEGLEDYSGAVTVCFDTMGTKDVTDDPIIQVVKFDLNLE